MSVSQLVIAEDKIIRYLLNLTHPVGGAKARFFMNRGFSPTAPDLLADALMAHSRSGWPGTVVSTPYGLKHRILGPMPCPDGSNPTILAVWQVLPGRTSADFVTAYPKSASSVLDAGTDR